VSDADCTRDSREYTRDLRTQAKQIRNRGRMEDIASSSPLLLARRAAAAFEDRLELAVDVVIAHGLDGGGVAVAERVPARGACCRVAVDDLAARRAERDGDLARAAVGGTLRRLRANQPVTYSSTSPSLDGCTAMKTLSTI